jgi:hypothetical protein
MAGAVLMGLGGGEATKAASAGVWCHDVVRHTTNDTPIHLPFRSFVEQRPLFDHSHTPLASRRWHFWPTIEAVSKEMTWEIDL